MITLRVTTEDNVSFVEKALPRDILQWELRDHKRSVSDFQKNQRYSDFYEIAWLMAIRKAHVPHDMDLKAFMTSFDVEPLEEVDGDEETARRTAEGWDFARRHGLIDPSVTIGEFLRDYPEIPEDQLEDAVGDPKPLNPEVSGTP